MLSQATGLKDSDPLAATAILQRCAAIFRGSDVGNDAGQLIREWKKDPAYQSVVKAGQHLTQLEAVRSRLLAALGSEKVSPDVLAAVPPAVKKQMLDLVKLVHKHGSGSRLTEQANAIATEFGLQPEEP